MSGTARRVGIDTGGTFTDLVLDDGRVVKVPSSPDAPQSAVVAALAEVDGPVATLAHGTTVATNALLERTLGRVALVTTAGFADIIEIARQVRPSLYDQLHDRPEPLVPRSLRFEVGGRLDADGAELEPVGPVPELPTDVDAVAVCLLHADLDPAHERAVAAVLRARGHDVVCSHEISPEFREYERTVTTVLNAALRPRCAPYLASLAPLADRPLVMTSDGGLTALADAVARPAALVLSGPAGGVIATVALAEACGLGAAVAFDMGGTSTDVCVVRGGVGEPAPQRVVAGIPVRLPSLAVHTIGAGGGSIAALDAGGLLTVGPRSAGARPGPAAYGHGGTEPTVTDADLLLGRIPSDARLPGIGRLDAAAARAACARAGLDPADIVDVVDESMAQAVRAVTVAHGIDPAGLALVAYGGAGPLHACAVAGRVGITTVVIPPRAGVFSAVGLLAAPEQRSVVHTRDPARPLDVQVAEVAAEAQAAVGPGAVVDTAIDARYEGQSHELTVPSVEAFAAAHARRNGYALVDAPVEVVAVRAVARRSAPVAVSALSAPARRACTGPAVLAEPDCTVWIPDGWAAEVGPLGAWVVRPR